MDPIEQYEELTPEQFDAKVADALTTAIDPHMIVQYNGVDFEVKDLPRSDLRSQHGYGHSDYYVTNRPVYPRPTPGGWAYGVADCLVAGNYYARVWVAPNQLSCCGCGVDPS